MKKNILILFAGLALLFSGCGSHPVTLAPGGVYTDPVLAQTDQAILDTSAALTGFLSWNTENSAFLVKFPAVGALAEKVAANKDGWIRDAYKARDAYAVDAKAYRDAIALGQTNATPPNRAKIDAALAVLTSLATQVTALKATH